MRSPDEIHHSDPKEPGTESTARAVPSQPGRNDASCIVFTFNADQVFQRNDLQYFEMFCRRSVVKPNRFNGRINWARIGLDKDDRRHSI